jgi:NAD dependent epimerase/dehydratase family enzyme
MSWVTMEDEVKAIVFAIGNTAISGPFNITAPHPVTNAVFTKALGRVLHRPTILPAPAFALRLAMGEMADALLLSSTRVMPEKLLQAGYKFRHPNLEDGLRSVIE